MMFARHRSHGPLGVRSLDAEPVEDIERCSFVAASTNLTPSERSLRASLASDTSWRNTVDRTARSQPGRDAMARKLEAETVAAIGESAWAAMPPAEQAKRIE